VAKTRLPELVAGMQEREEEVVVTKNGRPAAVLINIVLPYRFSVRAPRIAPCENLPPSPPVPVFLLPRSVHPLLPLPVLIQ
jgi:antitoxin (DNA-binding transcriptional repressor) of toxin-antitoxin stability system